MLIKLYDLSNYSKMQNIKEERFGFVGKFGDIMNKKIRIVLLRKS